MLSGAAILLSLVTAEFEAPPAPFQTTASPADGETVGANPPCFVYPAAANYDGYVVQVSPAADFPAAQTATLTSPWMLAVADRPMTPGSYYWRWRPGRADDGATEWSAVRAFVVPADAPVVPLPDLDALLRRIGTEHPRVLVSANELAAFRARARAVLGEAWVDSRRRTAEQLATRDLLPEPAMLPPPGDPTRIEVYQRTFQTTRPFFREMYQLAQDYLLTGHEPSGQEARRRLLHIIAWDPRGSTSIGHNDEPATEVIRYCPLVYDWIYPLLSEADRRACLECLTVRMQEMMDRWRQRPFEKYPYESHNMGYYLPDMLGAALALAGDAPVESMLRYTMLQLWSPFYPPYGGADGGWNEGPSYWTWSATVFAWTYTLVRSATGVPVHERSNLRRQAFYKLFGNPPYFRMSPFGDGHEGPAIGGDLMAKLAALYHNPYARWYAEAQHARLSGLDALLYDADAVEPRPPYDLRQGQVFRDVGLACLHSALPDPESNVALLFRSCPFGAISHAYADQNTFVLDAYGEPLIIASGYYQLYGHPHHAQWTRQTIASNSVLVDGRGQQARDWNSKGAITAFCSLAAAHEVVGEAHTAYPGVLDRFERRVVYLRPLHTGGEPVILIRDRLVAREPSTYQFLLHALDEMRINPAAQQVHLAHGRARCRVDFVAPSGLEFSQTDQFPVAPFRPSPNQYHLTASTREKALTASSLLALQPFRSEESPPLLEGRLEPAEGGVAVVLEGGGRRLVTWFLDDGAPAVAWGEWRTDAEVAAVMLADGQVRSVVVLDGTRLERSGTSLLALPDRGSGSLTLTALSGPLLDLDLVRPGAVRCGLGDARVIQATDRRGTIAAGTTAPPPPPVRTEQGEVAWEDDGLLADNPRLQRRRLTALLPVETGFYEVRAPSAAHGGGAVVSLAGGGRTVRRALSPGEATELVLAPVALGPAALLELNLDSARGGQVAVGEATVERVYGVNLLPNGSFEELAGEAPAQVRAGTISGGAECVIAATGGGRTGERCLQVTCTKATGGDFGAWFIWPGVPPSERPRRFRAGCWVKTDAHSVAGIQVCSRDWQWWKNSPRLRGATEWTESVVEFELPPGVDLTHARLHLSAEREGAVLWIDDVSLVELPPE